MCTLKVWCDALSAKNDIHAILKLFLCSDTSSDWLQDTETQDSEMTPTGANLKIWWSDMEILWWLNNCMHRAILAEISLDLISVVIMWKSVCETSMCFLKSFMWRFICVEHLMSNKLMRSAIYQLRSHQIWSPFQFWGKHPPHCLLCFWGVKHKISYPSKL